MSTFNALYGRASGVAEIQGHQIVFTSDADGSQIILALRTLDVSLEGLNSHHYYLFDKYRPENRICVQDEGILRVLAQKGVKSADGTLQKSQARKIRRNILVSSPFAITLGLLLAIPLLLSMIPVAWLSTIISPEQEKTMGQWLLPMIRKQHSIEDNHGAQPKIRALVEHIKATNPELQKIDFDVYVSASKEVNAFAAPGNIIVLNKGLIEKADSIDEVVGVLAHEMGHVQQKHVVKSLAGGIGSIFGTVILVSFIGYDGALVIANATSFLSLKYSRDDESAADRKGFEFLQRAQVSTQGMIRFFNKLANQNSMVPDILTFASTHPTSSERVAALADLSQQKPDPPTVSLPVNLAELKKLF